MTGPRFKPKAKPELRGHSTECFGLPGEPCNRIIDRHVDYPMHMDARGIMHYRCQSCYERQVLREARATASHEHKALAE